MHLCIYIYIYMYLCIYIYMFGLLKMVENWRSRSQLIPTTATNPIERTITFKEVFFSPIESKIFSHFFVDSDLRAPWNSTGMKVPSPIQCEMLRGDFPIEIWGWVKWESCWFPRFSFSSLQPQLPASFGCWNQAANKGSSHLQMVTVFWRSRSGFSRYRRWTASGCVHVPVSFWHCGHAWAGCQDVCGAGHEERHRGAAMFFEVSG